MKTTLKKSKKILSISIVSMILSGCSYVYVKNEFLPKLLLGLYYIYVTIKPWLIVIGILSFLFGVLAKLLAKKTPTVRKIGLIVGIIIVPFVCFLVYYGIPAILSNNYEYLDFLQ